MQSIITPKKEKKWHVNVVPYGELRVSQRKVILFTPHLRDKQAARIQRSWAV